MLILRYIIILEIVALDKNFKDFIFKKYLFIFL
jgi:hypothetical protein